MRLLNDLKDYINYPNGVQLSDYNVSESLFKGTGWKKYVYLDNIPYGFCNAASENQGPYTITQISYLHLIACHSDSLHGFELQTEIRDGLTVEYDHYTGQLDVLFYGAGLTFEDLQLAQGALDGDNIYINQTVYGVLQGNPKYAAAIWGLIPYADQITDVWKNLESSAKHRDGSNKTLPELTCRSSTVGL